MVDSGLLKVAEGEKEFIIYGPASVEVKDREGDTISGEALENALPNLLKRGRFSKKHEDIIVGEILPMYKTSNDEIFKTEVKIPDERDLKMFPFLPKDKKALFVAGEVYGDSVESKIAREDIIKGNLTSYSISGKSLNGDASTGLINKLDLDAITLCEQGMNPYAKYKVIAKMDVKNEANTDVVGVKTEVVKMDETKKEEKIEEVKVDTPAPVLDKSAELMTKFEALEKLFKEMVDRVDKLEKSKAVPEEEKKPEEKPEDEEKCNRKKEEVEKELKKEVKVVAGAERPLQKSEKAGEEEKQVSFTREALNKMNRFEVESLAETFRRK